MSGNFFSKLNKNPLKYLFDFTKFRGFLKQNPETVFRLFPGCSGQKPWFYQNLSGFFYLHPSTTLRVTVRLSGVPARPAGGEV
jgi:hypothetical protein